MDPYCPSTRLLADSVWGKSEVKVKVEKEESVGSATTYVSH